MTRVLIAILLAALASACANDSGEGQNRSDRPDAQAFKAEMDAEAKLLLPDLISAFGGELNGMQAHFTERGGFGIWDYSASGTVLGLPDTDDKALAAAVTVLEQNGFTVETDNKNVSLRAAKGGIAVLASSAFPGDDEGAASFNLTMGSAEPIGDGDDFAESAPYEDYLAYLK